MGQVNTPIMSGVLRVSSRNRLKGVRAPVFVLVVGGGLDECDRWPTFASDYFDDVSNACPVTYVR